MKQFRIIGKTDQMRTVFLRDRETGKFVQHKIIRGKTIEVFEDELTFHVDRQKGFKILDVVEIPEVEDTPLEETEATEKKETPKRKRGRQRKVVNKVEEIEDITNEIDNEDVGL